MISKSKEINNFYRKKLNNIKKLKIMIIFHALRKSKIKKMLLNQNSNKILFYNKSLNRFLHINYQNLKIIIYKISNLIKVNNLIINNKI